MKNGILVKFSKHMKFWRLLVIKNYIFNNGVFQFSTDFLLKKNQNSQFEVPQQLSQPSIGFVTKDRAQEMI
jgi:hypothetical protein